MKKIFLIALSFVTILTACRKVDLAKVESTGEGVNNFKLIAPASFTELQLNSATPSSTYDFTWNAAIPGLHTSPKYTFVLALKTDGITSPFLSLPSNNGGLDAKISVTHRQLDDALSAKGIATNAKADFVWSVIADNGSTTITSNDVFNISITRFGIGLTAFTIFGPAPAATVNINSTSVTDLLNFKWQTSKVAPAGTPVTYQVLFVQKQFDVNGVAIAPDFSTPLLSIPSDMSGSDTTLNINWKAMSDSLSAHGFTDVSIPAQLQWTVVATAGTFSSPANYNNDITIKREVKYYMVGSATQGSWTNPVSTPSQELVQTGINANSFGGVYNLIGNSQYLILPVNGSWDHKFGATCGSDGCNNPAGDNFKAEGNNLAGPASSGWYKMIFDFGTNTFTTTPTEQPFSGTPPSELFIVGDATPGSWSNPVSTPSQQFTKLSPTLFQITIALTGGGGQSYLLLPVNGSWDHKFGGSSNDFGSILADGDVPGSNTPAPAVSGTYKITVDFEHGFYSVVLQ